MLLSNLEYIPLRFFRRYLLSDTFLLRFGDWFPYYRVNENQVDATEIVDRYLSFLSARNVRLIGAVVLEIGAGCTNSAGYVLAAREPVHQVYVYEPHAPLLRDVDDRLFNIIVSKSRRSEEELRSIVQRIIDTAPLGNQTVDVIVSHSVLEHVANPTSLFREMFRLLKPSGVMLHIVDYRDHFFKYPYHFLQFSKRVWNRFLNPGDLPRWRLGHHLTMLQAAGFDAQVLDSTTDIDAFREIERHLSSEYDPTDVNLPVTSAVLMARPSDADPAG